MALTPAIGLAVWLVGAGSSAPLGPAEASPAVARIVKTAYPDGQVKEAFSVDAAGNKSGDYTEFYLGGAVKTEAVYRAGVLDGRFTIYHESGKVQVAASYRMGRRHGGFVEYDGKGVPIRKAGYRDGKLHGAVQDYVNGVLAREQLWDEGILLYPKSLEQIAAALPRIMAAEVPGGEAPAAKPARPGTRGRAAQPDPEKARDAQRVEAVRLLMCYRFLCDVPYEGMALDRDYNTAAQAGAELCARLGRIDHTPPNPGLPEARYKLGYRGTSHSNLSAGSSMAASVTAFMDDSDPGNIARVGHRRWLLNPRMLKTGLGAEGSFGALWSMDTSRAEAPDYDFVAYPARGYMPRKYFSPHYAWSVSLNPAKYAAPAQGSVTVAVFPVDAGFARAGAPLALNFFNVDGAGFGEGPAIIFRPERLAFAPRSRYRVVITGVKKRVETAADLEYLVEFVDLPGK
ncbi:MAG: hypothetical protein BWX69_02414 [Planctomycetes bacterium ADurb.Bin069]|jgi:hypothetical protein|nr:MAG: hypothetical protein BWX69_02414 [Planctomycetes bacterium ADurb.Bin069]